MKILIFGQFSNNRGDEAAGRAMIYGILNNIPDAKNKPLTFVNTSDKTVSILAFKSNVSGFDTTVEDWYDGKYPSYLHPKDRISDYMIQVALVEGNWNNYGELSVDPIWKEYFNKTGIITNKVDEFFQHSSVNLIRKWETSLIHDLHFPYPVVYDLH